MNRPQTSRTHSAFSLVELVIVVVIVGVIAAIAVPRISRASNGAMEVSLRATVRNVATKIALYHAEKGVSPPRCPSHLVFAGQVIQPVRA